MKSGFSRTACLQKNFKMGDTHQGQAIPSLLLKSGNDDDVGSPVIIKGLLQLALLLVHVAKVGVGLRQQGVLLDGQGAEVCRLVVFPALEMDRTEQQENPGVRWILHIQSCWSLEHYYKLKMALFQTFLQGKI